MLQSVDDAYENTKKSSSYGKNAFNFDQRLILIVPFFKGLVLNILFFYLLVSKSKPSIVD